MSHGSGTHTTTHQASSVALSRDAIEDSFSDPLSSESFQTESAEDLHPKVLTRDTATTVDPFSRLSIVRDTQSNEPAVTSHLDKQCIDKWEARIVADINNNLPPEKREGFKSAIFNLSSAVRELLEVPEIEAMDGRRQMTASYTARGSRANHTRLLHSFDVMERAVPLALNLGLDSYDVCLVGLAAFLHDVGHGPFSHSGESVLRERGAQVSEELGLPGPFHHEEHSWKLIVEELFAVGSFQDIRINRIPEILDFYQMSAQDVVEVLQGRNDTRYGKLSDIVDAADRHAYLIRDICGAFPDTALADDAAQIVARCEEKFFFEDGRLCIEDHRASEDVLRLRLMLYTEASMHEATLLADAVIREELRVIFDQGLITPAEFVKLTDQEALSLFRKEAREWLTPTEKGIEDHFHVLGGWRVSDLNTKGAVAVGRPSFPEDLQAQLAGLIGEQNIYVPRPGKHLKEVVVSEKSFDGEIRDIPIFSEIPHHRRYVFIAVPKGLNLDLNTIRTKVADYMASYLKPGAEAVTDDILHSPVGSVRDYEGATQVRIARAS